MRWSSLTEKLCSSHAYTKARRQPCSRWKRIRQQRRRRESPVRSLPKPETIAIKSLLLHTRSRHPYLETPDVEHVLVNSAAVLHAATREPRGTSRVSPEGDGAEAADG
jgi:hypothetical protein